MNPPWSMVIFTTLAGAAQGLLLSLVALQLVQPTASARLMLVGAAVVLLMSAAGLVAATFHLGHPLRAWRSAAMWRTSWLSREVIVLPAFMGAVALWAGAHAAQQAGPALVFGLVAAGLALLLYLCTGMIYAAVKAIREWAHPVTPLNFALIGIASGLLLCTGLAAWIDPRPVPQLVAATLIALVLAAASRAFSIWRNATLQPKTTTQSALGVRNPRIVQTSQGMTAGSFGSREFFHGRSPDVLKWAQTLAVVLGAALPLVVLGFSSGALSAVVALLLFAVQYVGLLAERWFFFAEARHPQNLYQQGR
jgi:sulfite dehydrogenase (quinone) subunit SoeC